MQTPKSHKKRPARSSTKGISYTEVIFNMHVLLKKLNQKRDNIINSESLTASARHATGLRRSAHSAADARARSARKFPADFARDRATATAGGETIRVG